MNSRKFLFIINPNSGVGKFKKLEKILSKKEYANSISYDLTYTKYPGHAFEISRNAAHKYDVVVAVGGDGSINEVGQGLIDTTSKLGIIPVGSGNGLARSLHIPMNTSKALDILLNESSKTIDIIRINNAFFFNVGGIGFDANVGHLFGENEKRGFFSYVSIVLKAYFQYQSQTYELVIDGYTRQIKAFLITFANSTQWGNNAFISPLSKIEDGKLEVCVIKPFRLIYAPVVALALFTKSIHKISKANIYSAKTVIVKNDREMKFHIDGEPKVTTGNLKIEVIPKSFKVIAPL